MLTAKLKTPSKLDNVIASLLDELIDPSTTEDRYNEGLKQLERLYALKKIQDRPRMDPNTLLLVGANLIGIVTIVGYERSNVITSKAMNFVPKLQK